MKARKDDKYENVKLDKNVVALVRKNKIKTLIPIGKFIERAIMQELKKQK